MMDWDAGDARGLPLHDLVHFLLCEERRRQGLGKGQAIVRALEGRLFTDHENDLLRRYLEGLSIEDDLFRPLVVCYWLRTVFLHVEHSGGRLSSPVERAILLEPLERLEEILA